jgi:hypothetical protein
MSDILMQDLSTESPGGLLETGGMIHIEAAVGDQKKSLQYGKEMIVHFPKNGSAADDMQLFSQGFYDTPAGSSNSVVWEEEPRSDAYEEDSVIYWYTKHENIDDEYIKLDNQQTTYYDWLQNVLPYSEEERNYLRFRDVNIKYTLTTEGVLENLRNEKKYDEAIIKRLMNFADSVPLLSPFTINGKPSDNDGWIHFYIANIPSKIAGNNGYMKSLEKKYPDFEKKSINDLAAAELHYFIFSSAKLGWLNVDRFVDDPAPKVNMTLTLENPEDLMVKLIYKDYKSVVPADFNNNIYEFNGIPENKKFTLMVIRNEPGKISMSITEHTTKSGPITGVTFKDYTMEELKKELKKLD